jgi:hypothetical protein
MGRRIVVSVLLFLVAAALWFAFGPRRTPAGQVALNELSDTETFRRWFNDSGSNIRVVVLLSPT